MQDEKTSLKELAGLFICFGFRKINAVFLIVGSAVLGYILQLL